MITKELQNLSNRVQQQRTQNRRLAKEKSDYLIDLEQSEEVIGKLEARCNAMNDKNLNAQQRLQVLEELMDNEDKAQREVNKETDRINGLIYRAQQQLVKFKEESVNLEVSKNVKQEWQIW